MSGKQVESKVSSRMRAVSSMMDLAAAKKQDMEVDSVLNETVELSISPDRERLVEPQAMKSWDFTTWKQCSEHLVTEHKDSILLPPKCGLCMKPINCCNDMCAHIFNSEVEYIDNCVLNLKRRLSKKMIKKGNIFGIAKDFAADKMLFTDISNDITSTFNPHTEEATPLTNGVNLYSSRSKRYICRTCGMGFSTATRRDKHVYSNTCVKNQVEKKFSCSVCSRRFITRRMLVNHETWCMYKDKRDKLLAADEQRSAAESAAAAGGQINNENQNPTTVSAVANDGDSVIDDGSIIDTSANTTEALDSAVSSLQQNQNLSSSSTTQDAIKQRSKRKRATDYRCNILGCSIGFSTETEKDVHLRCHVNNSITYKCCFCEYSPNVSINWYPLKEHIIAKHPGHIPPEFECGICNKGFAKLSKYEEHAIKHSSVKSHTCIECGVKFKQETGLRTHVQFEHGTDEAKEYARDAQKGRMTASSPVGNATLLCYVCGYSTTSRSYYKTHMNIHKGVKPYSCKFCDYSSVDSTCFKRHMWRHQEKKPYKCAYCPFDGIQRSQIIAHMKSKHNVWPEEARKLISHISGRISHNPKGTAGSNKLITSSGAGAGSSDDVDISDQTIHVQHQLVSAGAAGTIITSDSSALETGHHAVHAAGIQVVDTSGGVVTHHGEEGTTTATVSIVNPDGTETQIPVELLTQAAQGLAEGTNVQVAYGDYMINYMLEKAGGSEDEQTAEAMETTHEAMETTHEAVTAVSAVVETEGEVTHQQEYTGEATSVTQTTVEEQQA